MSHWSQDQYQRAIRFAGLAHGERKVPCSELPYLVHLPLVAMEVLAAVAVEQGVNGDLALQCALLHDVLEDTVTEYAQVRELFGADVADGILALSKDHSLPEEERMADSLARIRRQPREVWMVKLADRITNLQPPPADWGQGKVEKYRREAAFILDQLGDASAMLSARLQQKIAEYPGPDQPSAQAASGGRC